MATRERSSRRRRGSPYYSEEESGNGVYDEYDEMSEDDDVGQFGETNLGSTSEDEVEGRYLPSSPL